MVELFAASGIVEHAALVALEHPLVCLNANRHWLRGDRRLQSILVTLRYVHKTADLHDWMAFLRRTPSCASVGVSSFSGNPIVLDVVELIVWILRIALDQLRLAKRKELA